MRSMKHLELKRWTSMVARAAVMAGLCGVIAAGAANAEPDCPVSITACGCVISQPGVYTVANNLSASQTTEPNCIDIVAPHAILNLKGASVTGNNTGIGIHIHKQATSAIVEGGDETDMAPQATITQWDVGIRDDADHAIIQAFEAIGGVNPPGNVTGGVLLNHVKHTLVGDLFASNNGQYGVMVVGGSENHITNLTTKDNGEVGIELLSSNNNRIAAATVQHNSSVGIWLDKSSRNTLHDSPATQANGDTGVLIGCRLAAKNCTGNDKSDHNRVIHAGAPGNTRAGIVVRKHSETNTITVNLSSGNGGDHMDMVDENHKCDSNVWYNNIGNGNQTCIH